MIVVKAPRPTRVPEITQGSYYSGPTRISLVDTNTASVINTINIRHQWGKEDSFDIPYRILADYYYFVPDRKKGQEGKPTLLALHDFNGDGLPLEAAFYEAQGCMGLLTTLIGYSPKQDRVIQYQVTLRTTERKVSKIGES